MEKIKRVLCTIFCIAIIFSVFAISAYADRGSLVIKAENGNSGYLTEGYISYIYNYNTQKNEAYYFPKYSTIRFSQDVYTNDEYVYGTVTNCNTGFYLSDRQVPMRIVYIPSATMSLTPDIS